MREVDTGKCINPLPTELNRPCLAQSLAYWISLSLPPSLQSGQNFTYRPPGHSRGHCVDSHLAISRHSNASITQPRSSRISS